MVVGDNKTSFILWKCFKATAPISWMNPVQSTTYKMTFVRRTVLPFNSYLLKIGSTVPSGFSVNSVQVLGIQSVQLVTINDSIFTYDLGCAYYTFLDRWLIWNSPNEIWWKHNDVWVFVIWLCSQNTSLIYCISRLKGLITSIMALYRGGYKLPSD